MNDQPASPPREQAAAAAKGYRTRMRKQRIALVIVLALIVAFCVITYLVPPDEHSYFPRCTLQQTTGLYCPGCGGTRAVGALMHGDILQAVAYNLYFVLALPYLLWWGGYGVWATITGKLFGPPRYRPWLYTFVWVSLLAFVILRNVPVWPLDWLAPHKL
jgi:hypothetical protein